MLQPKLADCWPETVTLPGAEPDDEPEVVNLAEWRAAREQMLDLHYPNSQGLCECRRCAKQPFVGNGPAKPEFDGTGRRCTQPSRQRAQAPCCKRHAASSAIAIRVELERKQSIKPQPWWKSARRTLPEIPKLRRRPESLELSNLDHQKWESLYCVLHALGVTVQSRLDSRKTGLQGKRLTRNLGDYLLSAKREFRRHNHSGLEPCAPTEMLGGSGRPDPPRCKNVVPEPIPPLRWNAQYVDEGSRLHLRGIRQNRKFSTDWDGIHMRSRWPNVNWFRCRRRAWKRSTLGRLDMEIKQWVLENFEKVAQTPRFADAQIDELAAKMLELTGVDFRCEPDDLSPEQVKSMVDAYLRGDFPSCENCGEPIKNLNRLIHAFRVTKGVHPARYCDEKPCRRAAQAARKRLERRLDDILDAQRKGQATSGMTNDTPLPRKVLEYRETLVDGESDPWYAEPVTEISSLLMGEKISFCPAESRFTHGDECGNDFAP